jgi:hypothetical protein
VKRFVHFKGWRSQADQAWRKLWAIASRMLWLADGNTHQLKASFLKLSVVSFEIGEPFAAEDAAEVPQEVQESWAGLPE